MPAPKEHPMTQIRVYIYIYIYIGREREREREIYTYIYIYIDIIFEGFLTGGAPADVGKHVYGGLCFVGSN